MNKTSHSLGIPRKQRAGRLHLQLVRHLEEVPHLPPSLTSFYEYYYH